MEQERSDHLACETDDPREPTQAVEGFVATRREFLAGALATSSVALVGLPDLAIAEGEDWQQIKEIERQNGKLQATISIRNEERLMPDGNTPQIRYFHGADSAGTDVWPLGKPRGPLPGPTLRARVGDQVEITFLNHVDTTVFPLPGMDRAERGEADGCDEVFGGNPSTRRYPDQAGDDPKPGAPRHCFHASSTANLHFHGTHVTPDGLGDNVLLQVVPSPRVRDSSNPQITKPEVTKDIVARDFQSIFDKGPPSKWSELPDTWRNKQIELLDAYDKKLPAGFHLLEPTKQRIAAGLWPSYAIGAYPYCFKLTKYVEDSAGNATPYQMGQCPGTHWYHAHKHGSTAINVLNGMAGVFVIEGDYDDDLEKIYPELRKTQKVLIVQNFAEGPNLAMANFGGGAPSLWVNGQLRPTIKMQPGEVQLWRMVNASIRAVNTVLGFTPIAGAAPEIRQIAQDGVQFHEANYISQPFLQQIGSGPPANRFAPGNRIDLLIKAPLQAGSYSFKVLDTTRPFEDVLLTLAVAGSPMSMEFPTTGSGGNYPKFPKFLKDINPENIRVWRRLDFGWEFETPLGDGILPAPKFTIDGKQFSGERYDQTMILGDFEEWTLTNSTVRIAHPFHIHVNPFQVIEIYDPNFPDQIYKPDKDFIWQDVIAIPPAKRDPSNPNKVLIDPATGKARDPGYVKIRHPFVDFPGSYVLHCHMLAHEDRGMMQLIRVIRSDQAIPSQVDKVTVPHH